MSGTDWGWGVRFKVSLSAAAMVLLACSDSGGKSADSLVALGIDDGASKGETGSALVTADAPSVIKMNTGARLTIPEGAVDEDVEVVMKRPADRLALPLLKMVQTDYRVVSAPYVVTPHGKSFNKDLELSLPIAKGNNDRLEVAWLEDEDDTSWELHGKPKVSGSDAKIPVRHFSVYVLLERLDDAPLDAGTRDASADAGPLGTFPQRAAARLAECGLVAMAGKFDEDYVPQDDAERCQVECMLDSACADVESQFCDTGTPTEAYLSCVTTCHSYSIVECETEFGPLIVASCDGHAECLDGSDEANCPAEAFLGCLDYDGKQVPVADGCDGYEDCADGMDEVGCAPGTHFLCESGERVSERSRCDGYSDCGDATDEVGCVEFLCADGAQVVPEAVVCDLTRDCSDGSDEDQGCLKLTCEPRSDDDKNLRRARRTHASSRH